MEVLAELFPCLNILVLIYLKKESEVENYMRRCKGLENNPRQYSLYLHGYWLPWLEQLRNAHILKQGKNDSD